MLRRQRTVTAAPPQSQTDVTTSVCLSLSLRLFENETVVSCERCVLVGAFIADFYRPPSAATKIKELFTASLAFRLHKKKCSSHEALPLLQTMARGSMLHGTVCFGDFVGL